VVSVTDPYGRILGFLDQIMGHTYKQKNNRKNKYLDIPYILESNPRLVFATFLNEKKALLIRTFPSTAPCLQADCLNNTGYLVCLFRYAMQQGAFHCLLTIR
jgi:hypothetical protein